MTWSSQLRDLLALPMTGIVAPTAYDTAWVARVPDRNASDRPAFPSALEWLFEHQHPDGSWGGRVVYHHDRLQSTLRAALTLAFWQERQDHTKWSERIDAAVRAIWRHTSWLERDPYDVIGFELIVPTLVEEARARGFALPLSAFDPIMRMREEKLKRIPPELIYAQRTPLLFSAEFLGGKVDAARLGAWLDEEGSLGVSPSATAFYLLHRPEDRAARGYLERAVERGRGAAADIDPIDIFETAWMAYNAEMVWPSAAELGPILAPIVSGLRRELDSKRGASFASRFPVADLDDTAMAVAALRWAGEPVTLELLQQFEGEDYFHCYVQERNPSISVNVHLLDALRTASPSPDRSRMVEKARRYLSGARTAQTFWADKWHASPYYTTAHAIIALSEEPSLTHEPARWIVNTQRADGSWGYHNTGTAEETAYGVQALVCHQRHGGEVQRGVLERAARYLEGSREREEQDYTPLWIGKCLYTPTRVVHSTVLSALAMMEQR